MALNKNDRPLDVVIYGATGFTGRLVAEYFKANYGVSGDVKWAMAGRSKGKLEKICEELGMGPNDVPLIVADSSDNDAIQSLTKQTKVVLTTVGPYQKYGHKLVEACAANGTDYVDLCGEPNWMYDMINQHDAAAKKSGARIVFSCGFDSVPFDLGVFFLQQHAKKEFGHTLPRVRGRVRKIQGTSSGGTVASLKASLEAGAASKEVRDVLNSPFCLTPGFVGPEQPKGDKPLFDESIGSWTTPFVMAMINTKNVHRTNLLLKHEYGSEFLYDEMVMTGPGEQGEGIAKAMAAKKMQDSTLKPGEGPSKEEREAGHYDVLMIGENEKGEKCAVSVKGDMDPGYGSTSKMIAESALCLVKNQHLGTGGIWTPASVMGDALLERVQKSAGLTFAVEPLPKL